MAPKVNRGDTRVLIMTVFKVGEHTEIPAGGDNPKIFISSPNSGLYPVSLG